MRLQIKLPEKTVYFVAVYTNRETVCIYPPLMLQWPARHQFEQAALIFFPAYHLLPPVSEYSKNEKSGYPISPYCNPFHS